jgi:hypothetical protein
MNYQHDRRPSCVFDFFLPGPVFISARDLFAFIFIGWGLSFYVLKHLY